jgi:hypothetical protein
MSKRDIPAAYQFAFPKQSSASNRNLNCISGQDDPLAIDLSLAQSIRETAPTVDVSSVGLDQQTTEPAKPLVVAGGSVVQLAAIWTTQAAGPEPQREPAEETVQEPGSGPGSQRHCERNHKTVASSERRLALLIGAKRSTVRRAVHGLAATGAVQLSTSRTGTTVALAA